MTSTTKVGIREIARLANVSPGTVDRALHGRRGITEETRLRIVAIVESIGYSPDLAARALSVGRGAVEIGICIPREIHHYFDHLRDGLLAEARRYERLGVHVRYQPTERFGENDVQKAVEVIAQRPDVLIIAPGSPVPLTPVLDDAEAQGIRVVCVDTDAPASKRSALVSVDAGVCGRMAADLMAAFLPPGAAVVVITGMLSLENHAMSASNFAQLYAQHNPGSPPVDIIEAHEDEDESFRKCFALLSARENIAGIYVNTVNCLPVCRAISACGLSGKIRLITSDMFEGMLPYFDKGVISASIHGRPYTLGETAMRLAVDHVLNGRPFPSGPGLLPHVVTQSNCRLFHEIRRGTTEPFAGRDDSRGDAAYLGRALTGGRSSRGAKARTARALEAD